MRVNHWRVCLIHRSLKMNFSVVFSFFFCILVKVSKHAFFFFFAFGQLRSCQYKFQPSNVLDKK